MECKIMIPINTLKNPTNKEHLYVISQTKKLTTNQHHFISDLSNHLINGSGASIYEFPPTLDKDFLYCSVLYSLSKQLNMKFVIIVNNHDKILNLVRYFHDIDTLTREKNNTTSNLKTPKIAPLLERKFSCLNYSKLLQANSLDYDNYCIEQNASWKPTGENCPFYQETINYCNTSDSNTSNSSTNNIPIDIEDQFKYFSLKKLCPFYMNLNIIQQNQADIIICQSKDFTDYRRTISLRKVLGEENLSKYDIIFDECNTFSEFLVTNYSSVIDEDLIFNARIELYYLKEKINKYTIMNYSMNVDDDSGRRLNAHFPKPEKEIFVYSLLVNENDAKFPGTIRQTSHFLNCLSRLLVYYSNLFSLKKEFQTSIYSFQHTFLKDIWLEFRTLKSLYKRLLYQFYQIKYLDYSEMYHLIHFVSFLSLLATFNEGLIINSSSYKYLKNSKFYLEMVLMEPLTQYPLNNAIMSNITLLSGGIGNMEIFSKLMNNKPYLSYKDDIPYRDFHNTLYFTNIASTTPSNNTFYGEFLKKLCIMIPDGIVCYFSSTSLMESYIKKWNDQGVFDYILNYKLIFIEEQNSNRLSQIITDYKKSCLFGRGGILLLSVRNKASHFDEICNDFSRGIIFIGFPIETKITKTLEFRIELAKKQTNRENKDIFHYDTFKLFTHKIINKIQGTEDKKVIIILEEKLLSEKMKEYLPQWLGDFIHSTEDEDNNTIEDRIKQIPLFLNNTPSDSV